MGHTLTADEIVVAMALFLLTTVSGLTAYIFNDLRKEVKTNTRRLEGITANIWNVLWRLASIEDWLAERAGYHAPRLIGTAETEAPDDNP